MALLISLTLTGVSVYLNLKLTEEIESMFAGLVACLGLLLSLFFAPTSIKIVLLAVVIILPKQELI